jgi:hypothetical protein
MMGWTVLELKAERDRLWLFLQQCELEHKALTDMIRWRKEHPESYDKRGCYEGPVQESAPPDAQWQRIEEPE